MTDPDTSARLLIVGPPGAGKGTQASRIADTYAIPAISTGDIFRENVRSETELGVLAKSFMDRGEYVPDEVTNDLVADRLTWADADGGFLLDGFPRTTAQAAFLDGILDGHGHHLNAVIELVADPDETVQRLLKRASEQGRSDDTEEVIRHRLEVYARQTAPLLDLYEERGLLVQVDGLGAVDEVTERIAAALAAKGVTAA
ncbi:adenylate kinase [Herbiconiux sp. L3-i23]|uniref:adenylate kinase n=1 Tax=Herbiconiux sp. L3-i23 TaxID=2905871 RepID=UPI0020535E5E|nr:adenylate kinase [Herbiconiux sp. L3-i23]BDI23862.1 adenylate kinase [Herbiconiux sp. L3-i23]